MRTNVGDHEEDGEPEGSSLQARSAKIESYHDAVVWSEEGK